MRWARRHVDLEWPAGGPRWHLIVNSTAGELVGACQRVVRPPFELVPDGPAEMRCHRCDIRARAAVDGQLTDASHGTPPPELAIDWDARRELLALRAIVISSRNALHKTRDPEDHDRITDRVTELLAGLEEAVIRGGADAAVLARLGEARREVQE